MTPKKAKPAPKKVLLMITDAGGGHRGTANALIASIKAAGLDWDVRIINAYKELWPQFEITRKLLGVSGEDIYNFILKKNWTGWVRRLRPVSLLVARGQEKSGAKRAREYFLQEKPDLVLSVMPIVNELYAEGLKDTGIPYALLVSDLVDSKPYMWFTPKAMRLARFVASGCEDSVAQSVEAGAGERALETGLVLHPKYADPKVRGLSQAKARERFGLEKGIFTPMIIMGGYGGPTIRRYVQAFEASRQPWQVVACVGRNEQLKAELEALAPKLKNRLKVIGFTDEVQYLMRAADCLVSKPGPATIFESVAMGLPLALHNVDTMPQEVPNADLVVKRGYGVAVRRETDMFAAVNAWAEDPKALAAVKKRIASQKQTPAAKAVIAAMKKAMA